MIPTSSTIPTDQQPHSAPILLPESGKIVTQGRSVIKLSKIERFGRLARIISTMVIQLFNRHEIPQNSFRIHTWWMEFKTGERKINISVLTPLRNDPKTPNDSHLTDTTELLDDVLDDSEELEEPDHQEELGDSEKPIDHPEELVDSNEPNKPTGQGDSEQCTDNFDLLDDFEQYKDPSESDAGSEMQEGNKDHPFESETKLQEPVKDTAQEPAIKTSATESKDIPIPLPNNQPSSPGLDRDATIHDVVTTIQTQRESKELADAKEKTATEKRAEKIKAIRDVFNNKNVKNWLLKATKDPILRRSDFYVNLMNMQIIFQKADQLITDEAMAKYADDADILSEIRTISTADDLDQIIKQQCDKCVFNRLKKQHGTIHDQIAALKEGGEGKFKANMLALLHLVSSSTPTSTPALETPEKKGDDEKLDEPSHVAATINLENELSFTDFQEKLNEGQHDAAREGFIAFTEILQSGASSHRFSENFNEYQIAEEAVYKAIKELVKPVQDLLEDAKKPLTEKKLAEIVGTLDAILKSVSKIDNKPSLKDLLIENTRGTARAFLLLKNKSSIQFSTVGLNLKINSVLSNMKALLGAKGNDRLNYLIGLGNQVLANPEMAFNKYLDTKGVLQFETNPPADSSDIEKFLRKINMNLNKRRYTAEELLALEAFASVSLYTYIINPQTKLDSKFKSIADILKEIKDKISKKINADAVKGEVADLRKNEQNQKFYRFVKENIENTPNYPRTFWSDPSAAERMKIAESLIPMIGVKLASPNDPLREPAQLVHQNAQIGYEIYVYPGSGNEKPKLFLFITNPFKYALTQEMNHQLGLFGDPNILKAAQDIISNITSTDVLEGYQHDLNEGNLEIIASGFDNCGSAAAIVANRLAVLYPKARVTSISAGSTPVVTTEEAYNMNQADNFFPIRLKYVNDKNVDRTITNFMGDFSNDSFNSFPLLVRYNQNAVDLNRHNKEEYGNIDNFVPAMTNPLIMRDLYQELSDHIIYPKPQLEGYSKPQLDKELNLSLSASFSEMSDATPQTLLQVGRLDELIDLGEHMLTDMNAYDGAFLKLDQQKLSPVKQPLQTKGLIQKGNLTLEEQENTIFVLQQTIAYLKNRDIMALLTPQKAFSLLVASDTLLVNYMRLNTSIGKFPQLIDLLSEMRELAGNRLEVLYRDQSQRKLVLRLFKEKGANLEHLASRVSSLSPQFNDVIDIMGTVDFEDRFLDFLGFKIAVKGQDKIGGEAYTSKLHTSKSDEYDISLFTPEDPEKKQRIVVCCNGKDQLGDHGLYHSVDFGAGDIAILSRADKLKQTVCIQLDEQFKKHQFNASDVEIIVTGFGSEGAVATALGYFIAQKYEKQRCQVRSVGFGAPRFTTEEGANKIRRQQNFVPLRFLSPTDARFEWKMHTISDYPVSHNTYYTIPFQFRIVGALEVGGHNTNLYGDVQGIKTTMKSAYLMREVANERKRVKLLDKARKTSSKDLIEDDLYGSAEATVEKASFPKRIVIDTRHAALIDFSAKSVAELRKVEPGILIRTMKYCAELSEGEAISGEDKRLIQHFFNNFIEAIRNEDINENHAVNNEFYKKMINHGYKPAQLFGGKWKLQQIISQDLKDAMKAVKHAKGDLSLKEKEELILRRSYHRGILAGDLNGNRYKPAGGGVNGAVFFRHLESGLKRPGDLLPDETAYLPFLGVFKPHPETVRDFKGWFDLGQLGERVKAIAGMDALLNKNDPDKRVHNEIFAYELFHIFGFSKYVAFPTTLKFTNKNDAKNRPASFCAFIPGYDLVASHVKSVANGNAKSNILDEKKKTYRDEELVIWQMSKLFDFLAGNLDGHEGNAFVKIVNGKLVGAVNFDYDKAFATVNPGNIGNQYKWAALRISRNDFTEATKEALKEMLKLPHAEEKIKAFLAIARENGKQNFSDDQEKLLLERIELLKKIADGEIKQLSELKK